MSGLLQQATAQGARSTILRPLASLFAICVAGFLICMQIRANFWAGLLFAVMTVVTFVLFIGAYVYCLFNDREALRSETYSIQKLAIERGFVGDSGTGIIREEATITGKPIQPSPIRAALGERE